MSSQNFQNINETARYRKYLEGDVWVFDMVIEQENVKLSGEKDFFDKYGFYLEESIAIMKRQNILHDICSFKQ